MSDADVRGPRSVTIRRRQFGFTVKPATLTFDVAAGDGPNFVLRNRCGHEAKMTFPKGTVSDAENNSPVEYVTVADNANRKLSVDLSKDNYFEYTVAIPSAGIEAVGGSRPDIEIVR